MQHKYWISIIFSGLAPDFHYTNFFGDLFEKVGFKLICNTKVAFWTIFQPGPRFSLHKLFCRYLFDKVGFKLICNIKNAHHQRKYVSFKLIRNTKVAFWTIFQPAPRFSLHKLFWSPQECVTYTSCWGPCGLTNLWKIDLGGPPGLLREYQGLARS